jgi:hypothetical protein
VAEDSFGRKNRYMKLKWLLKLNGLPDDEKGINELQEKERVLLSALFKQYKKTNIKPNKNDYGIPQGIGYKYSTF